MAAGTLQTWEINGLILVEPKEAARYLGLKHKTLLSYIQNGKIPAVNIESRQFIERDVLTAFADSRWLRRQRRAGGEDWI